MMYTWMSATGGHMITETDLKATGNLPRIEVVTLVLMTTYRDQIFHAIL
jgi:hypothetical protein